MARERAEHAVELIGRVEKLPSLGPLLRVLGTATPTRRAKTRAKRRGGAK
jgi:hypothetical protein